MKTRTVRRSWKHQLEKAELNFLDALLFPDHTHAILYDFKHIQYMDIPTEIRYPLNPQEIWRQMNPTT
jgi:hypothetical protein